MTPMIVTFTSDFGTRDSYVAEMKAAVLALNRAVQLVDVTHEVGPQDIVEGALVLEAAAPRFPAATVHVAVVDPGVGTERRGLAVIAGGQVFVGPDNGLFTPMLAAGDWQAFELRAPEYRHAVVSRTFHGRDVFAPAAAHLTLGVDPARFGPSVTDPVRLPWPAVRPVAGGIAGTVLYVDRFGNLVTSIDAAAIARIASDGRVVVAIGAHRLPLVETYADLPPRGAGGVIGSRDRLEVAVRDGSAAARFRARRGTAVVVRRRVSFPRPSRAR